MKYRNHWTFQNIVTDNNNMEFRRFIIVQFTIQVDDLDPALPEPVLLLLRLQQLPGHGDDGDRPQPQERGRPGVQQVRMCPDHLETYQPSAAWWPGSSSPGRGRSRAGAAGARRPSRSCGLRWTSSDTWRSCRTRSAARWGRGGGICSCLCIYLHSTVVWISSIYCVRLQNAALYSISPWSLAIRRVPALLLTMSLELVGGVVIDQLHKVAAVLGVLRSPWRAPVQVIQAYTLIVSFMPAISALSGNLGLQASANTIRGLGTGGQLLQCSLQPAVLSPLQARSPPAATSPTCGRRSSLGCCPPPSSPPPSAPSAPCGHTLTPTTWT